MAEYLRNAWYMAGWESEIEGDALLSRKLLDRQMLLYRRADGEGYVMMEDRCAHRFAPLSLGRREGDRIVCGYHGLTYDRTGTCVRNPFSKQIPERAKVAVVPVSAKYGILWFWPGDASLAELGKISDFSFLSPTARRSRLVVAANYQLITDNLMDLSHIEFVHTGTFGGAGVIFKGEHEVKPDGDAIWSNWWMPNIDPPPWAAGMSLQTKLDHWLNMRWNAPATMMLETGICPAGSVARAVPMPMPSERDCHILTPETELSTHYFYTSSEMQDLANVEKAYYDEDKPILEAVQRSMGDTDFWGKKPVILSVDAGAVRVRRHLAKLMLEERGVAYPASAEQIEGLAPVSP
jgi:phenylpropionate dioxygenase-like ring-hydroxylating dioxygenase large terminal subunit